MTATFTASTRSCRAKNCTFSNAKGQPPKTAGVTSVDWENDIWSEGLRGRDEDLRRR